jgi:hypothetical protein
LRCPFHLLVYLAAAAAVVVVVAAADGIERGKN